MESRENRIILTTKLRENMDTIFSGTIYLLHAFDVGEDIDLEKVKIDKSIHAYTRT